MGTLGGTMPEDLPTPDKSIKQLQKEEKRIESDSQFSMGILKSR